jgi:hypothetical protein
MKENMCWMKKILHGMNKEYVVDEEKCILYEKRLYWMKNVAILK